MHNRGVLNLFVNGDGGVDLGGLDGFPVNDGLNGLVNVVVDVLGGYGLSGGQSPLGLTNNLSVLVQGPLLLELLPVLGKHVMLGLPGDLGDNVVLVLGGEGLGIGDGLNSVLVVVDVPFTVNSLDLLNVLW